MKKNTTLKHKIKLKLWIFLGDVYFDWPLPFWIRNKVEDIRYSNWFEEVWKE